MKMKLLPSLCKRTKRKQKSLKNEPIVVVNWLKTLNLIADNSDSLTKNEIKANIKRLSHLYIVDNKDLFEIFY